MIAVMSCIIISIILFIFDIAIFITWYWIVFAWEMERDFTTKYHLSISTFSVVITLTTLSSHQCFVGILFMYSTAASSLLYALNVNAILIMWHAITHCVWVSVVPSFDYKCSLGITKFAHHHFNDIFNCSCVNNKM
jgi:hypothetical protein